MDRRRLVTLGALWLVLQTVTAAAERAPTPRTAVELESIATASVDFEENCGQTDGRVRFVARAPGSRVFLTRDGLVLTRHASTPLRLRFVGAQARRISGDADHVDGLRNYFLGNDPKKWVTGVRAFGSVRYDSLYRGIDAVVYGADGNVEHDFVVSPGADPGVIALGLEAEVRASLAADGSVVVGSGRDEARLARPTAYQIVAGTRRRVAARFVLRDATTIGFDVGSYDRALPVVIDPVISYSTFVAGTADESGAGVTVDASGNAYVTGGTSSLDFPVTAGAYATSVSGLTDGFVAKVAPDGSHYVFATYFGGAGDDAIARAAVDSSGDVYVCGGTSSANFPTTVGAFRTTFVGGTYDGFVAKLDAAGSQLVYSTYVGGTGDDGASGVVVDTSGNAYITGGSTSNNYPTTPGAFDTNNSSILGLPDAVVTKINPTGSALVYSTYLGGGFNLDAGSAIALDASGNAFVVGGTNGGFPTTGGAFDTSFNGGSFDAFVTKVNTTGSALVYSTYLGGSGEDYAFGVAVDGSGNAYVTGYISSTNFPVASPFQASNAGGFDAYVTKVNASGNALVYSSYIGGSGNEGLTSNLGTSLQIAGGIAVDSAGAAYVTGFTDSTDFPVVAAWQPHSAGGFDAWVAKIAPNGASKTYASYLGGAAEERGLGIAADASGGAYVTGFTYSANFPTTSGVAQPASPANGLTEGFLTKIGSSPGDTAGIYVPSTAAWFLRTSNTPGAATGVFNYGPGGLGWIPLSGDWDGNGTTTAGVYDPSTGAFFLKNTNGPGNADVVFGFGAGGIGYMPLAGDWDGDGVDTIGLYNPSTGAFFLRNTNTSGPADIVFGFGAAAGGYVPVVGDWNGDGVDTIGIYAPASSAFFLRNSNTSGVADVVFGFGAAGGGFAPLAGDWNADGTDTVGIYQPSTAAFFLTNANAPGAADVVFIYGPPGATPIMGHWGG